LDDDSDPSGFGKITPEKMNETVDAINTALRDKPVDKGVKQKLNYAQKHWPAALEKYDQQEKILGEKKKQLQQDRTGVRQH
jgi:hypothetical protein